ncbi:hypothetical protein V7128_07325 [Neobacillus vireti]|uniref:hypothetical protein n=1 Tax=Neobacillus vireti TaxID=220686 RepID=UPI003000D77A
MAIMASGQLTLVDVNDQKQLQLYISSSQPKTQIYNPDNGSYTPSWTTNKPVLTPELFIAGSSNDIITDAKSVKWYVDGVELTANTTDYTIASTGVKTLTINTNVLSSVATKNFTCEVVYTDPDTSFDVLVKAEIEFVKVSSGSKGSSGANAITAVLSNDAQVVPTDSAGNNGNFSGATTTLTIYEGATDVTSSWTITQTRTSGLTVTEATNSKTATVTASTVDVGTVTFTATRSGYPTQTKVFTVSKAKGGVAGTSPTAYKLIASVGAIAKSKTGAYTPASITFSAQSQTGSASPVAYSGRFIIAETTDGTTYTDKYTSSANESSKAYTPSAGIKALRVRLYVAGGTTTMLDEQVIPVVVDGNDGQDAIRAVVWTPDGNVIRNSSGQLTAKCDLYKGSAIQTSGVTYQWYYQDPSQSTDIGGGVGYKKLDATTNFGTTGYTTNTLTIPASAILGVESFKCVATYSSVGYSDVCTVSDVSDPIQVQVIGSNVFKNGQGTVTLTAKLYQAGVEIDSQGNQGYTYTWYLYDANNNKVSTWNTTGSKTGKTITVDGADVNVKGNIVCEVSK